MRKLLDGRSAILFLVVIVASVVRIVFDDNMYINNILAGINVVSILFVYHVIIDFAEEQFKVKLKKIEYIGVGIQNKKIRMFKRRFNFLWVFFIVFGAVYIIFLADSKINDIISFLALYLSIETDLLSNHISEYFSHIK